MANSDIPIHWVESKTLKPNPKNPNTHSKEQIDQLAKILKYQGFRSPIVVSNQTGFIVVGHGRLMAANQLGITKVPVSAQDFEDEAMEYSHMVADNGIGMQAELDMSMINADFAEFGPEFDVDLLGLKDFTIDVADRDGNGDADAVPDVPQNVRGVELGDVYQLGDHRLMCGDSTDLATVEKLMNGEKADMVFTDPPYGISIVKGGTDGATSKLGFVSPRHAPSQVAKARAYKEIIGDDKPFDPSFILTLDIKTVILWGANHYASHLPNKPQWLIWDKKLESGTLDHNNFSDCELAWTNSDSLAAKIYRHTWAGMLRKGNREDELRDRIHPTQKPVGLCANVIKDFSKDNDKVLDLFLGSGSTLIACEKTNRKCYGMELDPHYCSVILERWETFTGKKAVKL